MKFFKKAIACIFAVLMSFSVVSCEGKSNVYNNLDGYYTEEGEFTLSPCFAYYNDGKQVPGLFELDPEMAKEVLDDGAFNVYFVASNLSPFDRKITQIKIDYIKNADGYDIVQASVFDMDNEVYIASGESKIIPCVFEKEFVNLIAKLNDISAKATIVYEGCVVNGAKPEEKANSLTASVKELKFTSANGIEGKFSIKNNFAVSKKINKISFMIYTDKGVKITKQPIKMDVDSTIEAGEMMTLRYAVLPSNVNEKITNTKLFDSVKIEFTEE